MVSMQLVNSKNSSIKKCAFCSHWYDPINSSIKPKVPNIGLWEFNPRVECMCTKKNRNTLSANNCSDFVCKI